MNADDLTWRELGIVRARELAVTNNTEAEIAARLAAEFKVSIKFAQALVEKHAEELAECCFEGRSMVRERAFKMAMGEIEFTKSELAALKSWAYQHLGWTNEGFAKSSQKQWERAQRAAARGDFPKLKVAK